jgi:TRAP-type C4-dicarboxylate transport system substrate-binding protein
MNFFKFPASSLTSTFLFATTILCLPFSASAQQVTKWQMALGPTVVGSAYQFYQETEIPRRIKEATAGRLEIVTHSNLVAASDVIDAVRDRRVDVGVQGTMYRGDTTLFNFVSLPGILPFEALPQLHNRVIPVLEEEARAKFQVELLGLGYWPRQLLFARRPASTFADLKGLKFRTHSYEILQLMKSVGGAPVSMPYAETYLGMQRGAIDGGVTSMSGARAGKWSEVATHLNWWPIGNAAYVFVVNKQSWEQLPQDLRAIVKKTFSEAGFETWAKADAEDKQLADEFVTKFKSTLHTPSKAEIDRMNESIAPIVSDWKKRAGERGPRMMGVINEVLKTNY